MGAATAAGRDGCGGAGLGRAVGARIGDDGGPGPGGAVTLIRLVSVPVAPARTVPTRVNVAVAPGDTKGTVQSKVTRSNVPDPFVFADVSVSAEGGNSWTSASVASPVPVLVIVMV